MIVVADTSPLCYLILIEHVHMLPTLYGQVVVPPAVVTELNQEQTPETVRQWLSVKPEWLEVRVPRQDLPALKDVLGPGEREAIALAHEISADALLMDDRDGRREAEKRELAVLGTIRMLADAANRGFATGAIDVAMIQSLNRKGEVNDLVREYGFVITDECHHISAFRFEQVLRCTRSRYVLGLTATPIRKDGHHPIFQMQCGPIRHRVDPKSHLSQRPFKHLVISRWTNFRLPESRELEIQEVFARLTADRCRNDQIFDDLIAAIDAGRSPLFLTERTDHLAEFAQRVKRFCRHVIVLKGGMTERQRRKIAEQIAHLGENEERVILATGRYIGEGFDDARLDTLFLAMPISWKGTLQQYVGRLHRLHANKSEVRVYDYVDTAVPVLHRMYERRCRGYRSLGYSILEPRGGR